jgi:hypothetical protein
MRLGPAVRCPLPHRSLSRRQFVGATAGLAVGAGVPGRAQDGNPHTDAAPTPIRGGVSPFGVIGRPRLAPGIYFRLLLVGYFEASSQC